MAYLETWRAIETANAVFSFDGWSTSIGALTVDKQTPPDAKTDRHSVVVSVIMRITLKDGTYREDVGVGSHENKIFSAALENAKKEAVSDALKRTARQFGNALGNSIYDKLHASHEVKAKKERDQKEREAGRGNTLTLPKGSITFAGVRQNLSQHLKDMSAHQQGGLSANAQIIPSSSSSSSSHTPSNTAAIAPGAPLAGHANGNGLVQQTSLQNNNQINANHQVQPSITPSSNSNIPSSNNVYSRPTPGSASGVVPVSNAGNALLQSPPLTSSATTSGIAAPHNTPVGATTVSPFAMAGGASGGSGSPFKGSSTPSSSQSKTIPPPIPTASNGNGSTGFNGSNGSNASNVPNGSNAPQSLVTPQKASSASSAAVAELLADLDEDDDMAMMESAMMAERKKEMKETFGSPSSASLVPVGAPLSPLGSSSPMAAPASPSANGTGVGSAVTMPSSLLPSSLAASPSSSPHFPTSNSSSCSASTAPSAPLTAEQKAAQIAEATNALMDLDEFT